MTQRAETLAKQNSTKQFIGRNGRRLSGRMLNSIFSGFEKGRVLPTSFVGTRGIPYGRIHEEGGEIHPVKAKHLWVKNYEAPNKFKRLTPTEFMKAMRANPDEYAIIPSQPGGLIAALIDKTSGEVDEPLFFLKKKVKIPKRPYLRPAVKEATKDFAKITARMIRKELSRRLGIK